MKIEKLCLFAIVLFGSTLQCAAWGQKEKKPVAATPPDSALIERLNITQPKMGLPLLADSEYSPVLGVVLGHDVYYSDAKYDYPCQGTNIYRFHFVEGKEAPKEELVATVGCVVRLFSDTRKIYALVHDEKDNTSSVFALEGDGRLIAQRGKNNRAQAKIAYRLHQLETRDGVPWFSQQNTILGAATQTDGWWREILQTSAGEKPILLASASNLNAKQQPVLTPLGAVPGYTIDFTRPSLSWDNLGNVYLLLKPTLPSKFFRLQVTSAKGESKIYGGDVPYTEREAWESIDKEGDLGLPIHNPSGLAEAQYGVVVHDRRVDQNEFDTVFYFPADGPRAYRVKVFKENLKGVRSLSVSGQGVVMSQTDKKRIILYTTKNIYGRLVFPPRHVDLTQVMTEAEVQKLERGE